MSCHFSATGGDWNAETEEEATEAWQEIRRILRDPSKYRPEVPRPLTEKDFSDPAIYDAAKAIGFHDIFAMREVDIMSVRARFITAFETFVNRRRMSQRMLPEVQQVIKRLTGSNLPQLEARDDD